MIFCLNEADENLRGGFEELLTEQGHTCSEADGIRVLLKTTEDNMLCAEYKPQERTLTLSGRDLPQMFRGLFLFLQKADEQGMKNGCEPGAWRKEERAGFQEMGPMYDCSRNGALNISQIKQRIRRIAAMGMNQILLYIEDLYTIDENPYFGAFRGRYTKEELRELDDYAFRFGLELIPCIQTLAHLNTFLRWPSQEHMRDIKDILLSGDDKVIELIRQMIKNVMEPLRTKKIHLGMDEAELLGFGKYMVRNGYTRPDLIMKQHLETVNGICRELGYSSMIWSDMYVKLLSPTGGYYDLPDDEDVTIDVRVPSDLRLVYWDYYHHTEEEYLRNIRFHQKFLGTDIAYAAGGWTWNGTAPNYTRAAATMRRGMKVSRELGIPQAICTFWYDNGAETPMACDLFSTVCFAQLCYAEQEVSVQELYAGADGWLKQFGGFLSEDYMLLDALDKVPQTTEENEEAANPSKYLLYQDVLMGLFDKQTEGMELGKYYRQLADKLQRCSQDALSPEKKPETAGREEMIRVFRYYTAAAELLSKKAELGLELAAAYKRDDRKRLGECAEILRECERLCVCLKDLREDIWMEECRPFGWEVLDIRLGGLTARLQSASKRIRGYLEGKWESLPELEEERLFYKPAADGGAVLPSCNLWERIVSAGNMCEV